VNVRSIYLTTRFAVPHMRKQGGGSIICVGSISSFVGQLNTPCYTASKGAVLMLTKSFAVDYGRDGIRANCICPGITDTPLLRHHVNQAPDPEALMAERLARVPTGEMLYPDDMGNAAVFLCSDAARGITGTSLVVDGGYISCAEFSA
jgi:NAD(P)-dependent dehydrogenase (short-subunit alcohol dehydrogenase family)